MNKFFINGIYDSLASHCRRAGVNYNTVRTWIKRGKNIEEIIKEIYVKQKVNNFMTAKW